MSSYRFLTSHLPGPFEYRFSPSAAAVPLSRHLLAEWLGYHGVRQPVLDDLLMACSELCTNAVQHASGPAGMAALRAWLEDETVIVEVEDDGPGIGSAAASPRVAVPDLGADSGRGLFLVQALTDGVEIRPGDTVGTVVRCYKKVLDN